MIRHRSTRPLRLVMALCSLLLAAIGRSAPARATEEQPTTDRQPPNIVFILADDLGWADIGYHDSDIQTPNLDRLAAEGARLHQHYVYATCSPTRVALLSGRYPSRFGVLAPLGATTHMAGEDAHLTHGLRAADYRTHLAGKWHIGETPPHRPRNYGFDTTYGYLRGQIDPYTHRYKFGDHVTWHRNDSFVEEDGHVTDLITREAVRVIEEADDRPFFLYVAHHSPHSPLNEPPKWIAPYDETIPDLWRRHFAAAVTHVDDGVGQIVQALRRTGKSQNTLIVFSSDNGGQQRWDAPESQYNGRYAAHQTLGNNRPLRGWKGELYEGGIRVPAFVHWPGVVRPGTRIDRPIHICDWVPTLISFAGGSAPTAWQLDGTDRSDLLLGKPSAAEPRTLFWRTPTAAAVRHGDWKWIRSRDGKRTELFDLAGDPHETTDLASRHPERVEAMARLFDELHENDWENR